MALCRKPAHSFVRDTFSPCIGVITSEEANEICQKNHLSFVELLLPFSRLTSAVHIRDASGSAVNLQDFSVQFKDASSLPPQSTLGVRMLTEAVGTCCPRQEEKFIQSGNYEISAVASTPWFEEYRECFLNIIAPSDHEFLRHYTACLFVVSSTHADPMNQFAQLTTAQHQQQTNVGLLQQQTPAKLPKWFASDLCRYYVLLHDCTDGEDSKAEAVYQSMKSKYGVHSCHLLRINSVLPNVEEPPPAQPLPDPWSNFIKPHSNSSSKEFPGPESKSNGIIVSGPGTEMKESSTTVTVAHPLGPPPSPGRERNLSGGLRRPRTRSISERGCWLSTHDHDRLKTFVQEFVVRALIPWAERLIKSFNDLYQSKKRGGLFKSLFNRGRQSESRPVTGGYTPDSPEMQLRRLADLCFMFQMYEQAYSVYHTLKKDFEGDKNFMHSAGAQVFNNQKLMPVVRRDKYSVICHTRGLTVLCGLTVGRSWLLFSIISSVGLYNEEMAGLSIFMQGPAAQRNYPTHYLDGAIDVYQTYKSQTFMTRSVFLSTEVLKVKGLWFQAASQFLKLTGEEFDLRSAVLLEQAAYCYLNMTQPQIRKFAFYMVLAGYRYSKSSQRKHALRCYSVALQVYENQSWTRAQNHIGSSISRLSSQLNFSLQALSHSSHLLTESPEPVSQQCAYLREYLQLYQTVRGQGERSTPEMVVPKLVDNEVMITTEQFDMATNSTVYSDDSRWAELEEACVLTSRGSLPLIFNKSVPSYNKYMKNTRSPLAVLGETQFVRVMVHNPLKLALQLSQVYIGWRFQPSGEDSFTQSHTESPNIAHQIAIPLVEIPPLHKQWILFRLVPKALGILNLQSLNFNLAYRDITTGVPSAPVEGKIMLNVRGPRLNNSAKDKTSVVYGEDKRLFISIQPPLPRLKVLFQSMPEHMQCGEIVKVPVTIINTGPVALHKLHVTCSEHDMVTFPDYTNVDDYSPSSRKVIALDTKTPSIQSTESVCLEMWVRAGDTPSVKPLNFMFYYELADETSTGGKIRHRCSRYSFVIRSVTSLSAQCNTHFRRVRQTSELGNYLAALLLLNCSNPSKEAAVEYAVTDVMCKSKHWQITSLDDDSSANVKVNQSEVALLTAHLKNSPEITHYQLSHVHLNSEQVDIRNEVLHGFLSTPFIQPEPDPVDEEHSRPKGYAVVMGVLWKGFRMDVNGITTQTVGLLRLPILTINDDIETRTERSPSLNSQFAVLEIPRKPSYTELPSPGQDDDRRIEYQLLFDAHVKVDMVKNSVCAVPVTLVMKSYSTTDIHVSVSHQNADGLMWSGKTYTKVKIPPKQETCVKLKVTVLRHGVYNLNTLTITGMDNVFIRDHTPLSTLLVVEKG